MVDLEYHILKMISDAGGRENLAAEIIIENSEYFPPSDIARARVLISHSTHKRILQSKVIQRMKPTKKHMGYTLNELLYIRENWGVMYPNDIAANLGRSKGYVRLLGTSLFGDHRMIITANGGKLKRSPSRMGEEIELGKSA